MPENDAKVKGLPDTEGTNVSKMMTWWLDTLGDGNWYWHSFKDCGYEPNEMYWVLIGLAQCVLEGKAIVTCLSGVRLKKRPYDEYILSDAWKQKAESAKKRAGYRCQVCNSPHDQAILDTHHRTYERLGHEEPADLIVLCRSCHQLFHDNSKLARPPGR